MRQRNTKAEQVRRDWQFQTLSNMAVNLTTLGCATINNVAVCVTDVPTVEAAASVNHHYKGAYTTESYEVEWAVCVSFSRNLKSAK